MEATTAATLDSVDELGTRAPTIKIRQAGFTDCIDSEQMFVEQFDALAAANLIPPRR
jgi:hypothetical protein